MRETIRKEGHVSQIPTPIDLRSDTVTRPDAEMRKAIARAEVGDDVFGEDPTMNRLLEQVSARLGKEAAIFVPSGTMGNQICVNVHTRPGDEALAHVQGHVLDLEGGAAAALAGVHVTGLPGANGVIDSEVIRHAIRPPNEHSPRTRLLCLENTHNVAGGTIWPLEALEKASAVAHQAGLVVHLDGARIWNASVATGVDPAQYAQHADTVMVCFSKGLGAPVGSAVAGSRDVVDKLRYVRKKYGGAMRQVGVLAAACLYALENNIDRLADDHKNAALLAGYLGEVDGVSIPHPVETNIIVVNLEGLGVTASLVVEELKKRGVLAVSLGENVVRFVTHKDVNESEVEKAGQETVEVLRQVRG